MLDKNRWLNKPIIQIIIMIAGALVYLYLALWLQQHAQQLEPHQIFGLEIPCSIANGVVTQLQMLIAVSLVLMGGKKFFILALCLNFLSLFSSLMYVFRSKSIDSVPGILSYIGVMIIVLLIGTYKRRIKDQVSILRSQESELRELAYYDGLTGVLNRKSFINELNQQLKFSSEHDRKLYIVFIDIDDFKLVNDTLGHHAGDHVLQELAARIKSELHVSDIIGRLGGDELGLIIRNDVEDSRIKSCLKAIHGRALQPYTIEDNDIRATVSVGASAYPDDGITSEELLKRADIAMYQAKMKGKSQVLFYSEINETDARKALSEGSRQSSYGARPFLEKA
ncbi:MAG: GGDEF domain-containing protein [Clostridiaceae bacterium]|nr:GGDEF domain-containing protein [Clostridiaceae bacterium]